MPVLLVPDEQADAPVPRVVGGHGVLVRLGDEAHELVHQNPQTVLIWSTTDKQYQDSKLT